MKKILVLLLLSLISIKCNTKAKVEDKEPAKKSKSELKMRIQSMDDSLQILYDMVRENKLNDIPSLNFIEAANRQLDYYHAYPEDDFSATCLDKAQQLYTQLKSYRRSLAYSDTLLQHYPKYERRTEVLLNAGSVADALLNDRERAKKYYTSLLKDVKGLHEDTREMVQYRLDHIDLSFDEMIALRQKEDLAKSK